MKFYMVYRDSDYKNAAAIFRSQNDALAFQAAQSYSSDVVEVTLPYALITTYTTVTFA